MTSSHFPPRKIGESEVSPIGFGAMGIGVTWYGKPDSDEERFKVLDRLLELGCNHWDTSSVYGDSEELLGKWFAKTGNRDKVFLATKFGFDVSGGIANPVIRGDAEYVKQSCETSLKLLQTDHIDLSYQHRPDAKTPIEITVGAMKELVEQGKVKYLGLSEMSVDTLRRAHKVHPISVIQVEYSPWERDIEKPGGLISVARELGVAIVAYSPIGRGLITGRFKTIDDLPKDDFRRYVPRYKAENWPRIIEVVDAFKKLGDKYSATPAQVAMAWLLEQGNDILPIPGSKQVKYVEENVGTVKVKLSAEDLKELQTLCDTVYKDLSKDERYDPTQMSLIGVETPPLKS